MRQGLKVDLTPASIIGKNGFEGQSRKCLQGVCKKDGQFSITAVCPTSFKFDFKKFSFE